MWLNKDEVRICYVLLSEYKYDFYNDLQPGEKQNVIHQINCLEKKLEINSKDQRRTGRRSHDTFRDLLRRYKSKKC